MSDVPDIYVVLKWDETVYAYDVPIAAYYNREDADRFSVESGGCMVWKIPLFD